MKGAAERSYRTRFLLKSHATTFAHSASVARVCLRWQSVM